MLAGISTSISGLQSQQLRMDALANDLANADTTGYRASLASSGSAGLDVSQGAFEQTGQPLDLAIAGDGWFQVRQPNGQLALTRAGDFSLDASGQVVTSSGDRLEPPLTLPPGVDPSSLSIAPNGAVSANGSPVGTISLVSVPAPSGLVALGGGLYAATSASGAPRPSSAQVQQGALEQSNADPADAIVGMIETRTAFAFDVGALRTQDETLTSLLDVLP